MEENKINLWSEAGVPGLILGGVSIIYLILSTWTGSMAGTGALAFLIAALKLLLWGGKLYLCIRLLHLFLLQFSRRNASADNRKVFQYGMVIALLSAIVYAVFYYAYIVYINPDMLSASFDLAMQQYAGMLDSSSLEAMENMRSDMPLATLITNFAWCFLFGTILSYIFSRHIPSDAGNPFKDEQ